MIKDLAGKTDGWGELSGYTVEGPCELPLKMGNENQGFRPRPRRGSARACAGRGGWEKPRLQAPRGEARALDPVLAPAPTRLARPSQDQGHLHLQQPREAAALQVLPAHVFVETLDKCFENVCELYLIFHVDKVHNILAEMVMGGMVLETNMNEIVTQGDAQKKLEKSETGLAKAPPVLYLL